MNNQVSGIFLTRKKTEQFYFALWGIFLGCVVFAAAENVPWYLAMGVMLFLVALSGGSSWLSSKRIMESLDDHCLELRA